MSATLYIDNHDGLGLVDYTRFWTDVSQFTEARNNEPTLWDLTLIPVPGLSGWVLPTRGSYVKFIDTRFESRDGVTAGVLFTGYVTDDPDPDFLGEKDGQPLWSFLVKVTSDDYLLNLKAMPVKVYVNKTHGEILRDLITLTGASMDTSGVDDGGTELLYQVDPRKKLGEIASDFAEADGYVYYAIDGKVFYLAEVEPWDNDASPFIQNRAFEVSEADPRFNPRSLSLAKNDLTTSIVNDVTVMGLDEPRSKVREYFLSDGYSGEFRLRRVPYGVTEEVLVSDDLTADINTSTWQEVDDEADYLQGSSAIGALNLIGGTGTYGDVYLISRKGIELWGLIETRDGELYFPPSPTGEALVGGLYSEAVPTLSSLWAGWHVDMDPPSQNGGVGPQPDVLLTPYGPDGAIGTGVYLQNASHHYILRKQIYVDRLPSMAPRPSPYPLGLTDPFYRDIPTAGSVTIVYTVEDIDWTDVNNVIKTTSIVATYEAPIDLYTPLFVLYAPVSSKDGHLVLNYVDVHRPSQVFVTVDGNPVRTGSYLDGGRCTIVEENGRAKLSWYGVNGATGYNDSYYSGTLDLSPTHYYRLRGGTATQEDDGPLSVGLTRIGSLSTLSGGVPDDSDEAVLFEGSGYYVSDDEIKVGVGTGLVADNGDYPSQAFTIEFLINTARNDTRTPIFDCRNGTVGLAVYLSEGKPKMRLTPNAGPVQYTLEAATAINDGKYHHVAFVLSTEVSSTGTASVYIDGALSATASGFGWVTGLGNAIYMTASIGYSQMALEDGDPANVYAQCALDELAIYPYVLSAAQVLTHAKRMRSDATAAVTVPEQGSEICITYREKAKSRARIQSPASILDEQAKFGDDGIRQRLVGESDVFPPPRTSEECLEVARAVLADSANSWTGSYRFLTQEGGDTDLVIWPRPGDRVPVSLLIGGETVSLTLPVANVSAEFAGPGVYDITLDFGDANQLTRVQRELYRLRKSSLEDLSLEEIEVFEDDTVEDRYPPTDLPEPTISAIDDTSCVVTFGDALPAGVDGIEVRRSDSGWGSAGYIARETTHTFSLDRGEDDQTWYFKSYASTGSPAETLYSERSSLARVVYPLANTIILTGIEGEISATRCRLRVPYPKSTAFAGIQVRLDSATGQVIYEGDGVYTKRRMSGLTVLIEDGRFVLDIPNPASALTMTFWLCAYNLRNAYGPGVTVLVDTLSTTIIDTEDGTVITGGGGAYSLPLTIPSQRILGRNSSGTGAVEILTTDTVKEMLHIVQIVYLGGSRFHAVQVDE